MSSANKEAAAWNWAETIIDTTQSVYRINIYIFFCVNILDAHCVPQMPSEKIIFLLKSWWQLLKYFFKLWKENYER